MYAVHVDGREVLAGFLSLRGALASRRSIAAVMPRSVVEVHRDPFAEPRTWGHVL